MQEPVDEVKRKRYRWGMLLAWIPIVVFMTPLVIGMLRAVAMTNRATGVGAVAGGLSEAFVLFGVLSMLAFQVAAILLLARSVGGGNGLRSVTATLSIMCSVLMIILVGLSVWMVHWITHRMQGQ